MGVDPHIMDINDVRNNEEAFWTYCEYQDKGESISNNIAKIEAIKASITKYQEQLQFRPSVQADIRFSTSIIERLYMKSMLRCMRMITTTVRMKKIAIWKCDGT